MVSSPTVWETIISTVAEHEDTTPEELPPLAEHLDAETIKQLKAGGHRLTERLTFEYCFYEVVVCPDGDVIVTP